MSKRDMSKAVRSYLSQIGRKGGEAKGKAKRRGDATYYKALAERRWGRPPPPDDVT